MVIPKQYPYDLYALTTVGGSQDANGDIIPGSESWINVSKCRDEVKTGTKVDGNDGTRHDFSAMIYTPAGCPILTRGAQIEVRNGSSVRIKGSVKLFDSTANHCRIWA